MSEEIRNAPNSMPYVVLGASAVNFAFVFPMVLTVAYHIPNLDDALNDPTTYPAIYILRQAFSAGGVTAVLSIILFLNVASNVSFLAATTRDLFAFARDKGVPFSNWISKVDHKRVTPVNATILSSVIAILLSCIYIGSPVAFYALTSLSTVAMFQCYCFSIGCLLWRRIKHPETLPASTFSLGKFGPFINGWAVLFSLYAMFWCFWPQKSPVTAAGMNWAGPIFVFVLLIAFVDFQLRGKKQYFGPVVEVEGRREDL